ncbi:MAG: class I tRNA ligase family protein, partial [bacterium]
TNDLLMPITTAEGTGLVHTAVSAGTEDFNLGRELGLPMISVINDDASYLAGFDFLSGKNAKENPRLILNCMEEKGFAFKVGKYTHRYPACWRCKTELVWKVTDEWYIAMDHTSPAASRGEPAFTLRERMKRVAKRINWIPEFGLKRELDWLDSMHDWLISKKNRYWGLALPIWECTKCGNFEVVGSKDELKEKTVEGWGKFEGKSPHKPQIDEIKIKCSKCGETVSRIEPVGNPWLDAGIVPFSTISGNNKSKPLYLTDREEWLKWYPVDFITESFPGQFKNWFYAMIAMSTVLEDREPFKSVLGFASLLAEDGRPMHKSWGNSIEFNEGADKIGVDVLRWMYVRQDPGQNLLFGYKAADETRRQFHLKLWNIYNFFVTYANLDGWKPKAYSVQPRLPDGQGTASRQNVLDRWILIRLEETIKTVTECLEKYDPYNSSGAIDKFVDDLSLWYIRRSRGRVGFGAEDENDKNEFYNTCYYVLTALSKILAPFNPFISEVICKNLTKKESVHLADWPGFKILSEEDTKILGEMQIVRNVVEKGHSLRKEGGLPVRRPLLSLATTYPQPLQDLQVLVKDEINVKDVFWGQKEDKLDTTITPQLEAEAKLRNLIRKIQGERKNKGLDLTQKIDLWNEWLPEDDKDAQWLIKKAQIRNISKGNFKVINVEKS